MSLYALCLICIRIHMRNSKMLYDLSYIFGKYNYFDKKSNLIPTIFPIIAILILMKYM